MKDLSVRRPALKTLVGGPYRYDLMSVSRAPKKPVLFFSRESFETGKDLYCTADGFLTQTRLKEMEKEMGRTPEEREQGIVRIDLDLLLFDQQRYHERDWERDYIRRLLDDF